MDIFERSFEKCGFTRATRNFLLAAYREEHRYYHDLSHIADLLFKIERLGGKDQVDLMQVAWFHDAVYRCMPGPDEGESADLLCQHLRVPLTDPRARAILDTAGHENPSSKMAALFCDLDLSRIGNPNYDDFILDGEKLRAEYSHASDVNWLKGRSGFLESLAARQRIFHTERAQALWEIPARKNIQRAVAYYAARLEQVDNS